MKLIVISSPVFFESETSLINEMFHEGLECFHLRKPHGSRNELRNFLDRIEPSGLSKIVLHSYDDLAKDYSLKGIHLKKEETENKSAEPFVSTSFHRFEEIQECRKELEYAFLSPVFTSISKENYTPFYSSSEFRKFLSGHPFKFGIIALGGIQKENISSAMEMGFDGVAILGALWQSAEPLKEFLKINEKCQKQGQLL